MSTAPVSVRFDVTGSDRVSSEIRKIEKDLGALRTSSGTITSSVKQMETGFRRDIFGGFSSSITAANTKITGFRATLSQVGSTFAQNATSFGVATASIWGVYNAYDSLEKVQIRAHAAQTRVATLETTIATLTARRDAAVKKGNLSAEQLAILDDRITNAHSKLAVAQERNADLQQDVNEAWAGFASQVGPQVVAAGSSIVQLVTNLRGSFGGIVPAIKGFFGAFSGGSAVMSQVNAQWVQSAPALRNMAGGMKEAEVAAKGMSTAMKGLLIGGGIAAAIFGIGEAMAYFRDQEIDAVINSKSMNDALATSDQAMQDFTDTSAKAQQTLDLVVKGFGADFQKLIDKAKELSVSVNLAAVTADIGKQKNAIVDLNGPITALKEKYAEITKNANFFDIISGRLEQSQNKLKEQITDLTNKQNAHGDAIKTDTALVDRLKASLALKAGVQNKDTEFLLEAVAAGYSFADASQLLNTLTEGGTKSLNDHSGALATNNEQKKTAKELTEDWLRTTGEKIDSDKAENAELQKLAVAAGLVAEGSKNTNEHLKQLLETYLKTKAGIVDTTVAFKDQKEVIEAHAAAFEESFKIANDSIEAEKAKKQAFEDSIAFQKQMVTETFGAAAAAQKAGESNADYAVRLNQLSDIGKVAADQEKAYTLSLIQTAVNLGINKTRQIELNEAIGGGKQALIDLITQEETLVDVLNDGNRNLDLRNQGLVQGRTDAISWYDQMIKQIAADEQFAKDQDVIAKKFANQIPAGISLTREQMTSLITSMGDAGKYAQALGDVMNTVFSASRGALQELIDAAVEGGKSWKDKWKDIKDLIPKDLRKTTRSFIDDQADIGKTIDGVITKIGIYRGEWDLLNEKQKKSATKDLANDLQDLEDQLGKVTKIDVSKLVDPLIKMKENGLTTEELNTWQQFFELYNKLSSEGGGLNDEDVRILQEWVAQHTGMKDLGDETADTATAFEDLDPAVQKIALNNILARTIVQVTTDINLQARAVRGLTSDFNQLVLIMQKMVNLKNQTGGGKTTTTSTGGITRVSSNTYQAIDPNTGETVTLTPGSEEEKKFLGQTEITKTVHVNMDAKNFFAGLQNVFTQLVRLDSQTAIPAVSLDGKKFFAGVTNVLKQLIRMDSQTAIPAVSLDGKAFFTGVSNVFKQLVRMDRQTAIPAVSLDGKAFFKGVQNVFDELVHMDSQTAIPAVDLDPSDFDSEVSQVESKLKQLDGKVVTVTIKAKRVGNFSAQHGMHASLAEDSWIYAHKGERVDIAPPSDLPHAPKDAGTPGGPSVGAGGYGRYQAPTVLHIEMPVYLFPGGEAFKRYVKDIPLADTGMFPSA